MIILKDRILLHLQDGRRIPVDPQEIYLLEAEGGETRGLTIRRLVSLGWCLPSLFRRGLDYLEPRDSL